MVGGGGGAVGESGVLRRALPLFAALFLVVLVAVACRPAVEADLRTPSVPASATSDLSLLDSAPPRDIVLGKLFAPDGSIQPPDRTTKFSPGAPIFLSVDVGDLPGGTSVVATWTAPDGTATDQATTTIGGEPYVTYTAPSAGWTPVEARVTVRIGEPPRELSRQEIAFEIGR